MISFALRGGWYQTMGGIWPAMGLGKWQVRDDRGLRMADFSSFVSFVDMSF